MGKTRIFVNHEKVLMPRAGQGITENPDEASNLLCHISVVMLLAVILK